MYTSLYFVYWVPQCIIDITAKMSSNIKKDIVKLSSDAGRLHTLIIPRKANHREVSSASCGGERMWVKMVVAILRICVVHIMSRNWAVMRIPQRFIHSFILHNYERQFVCDWHKLIYFILFVSNFFFRVHGSVHQRWQQWIKNQPDA
jgi:hypothetical protein